MEKDGEQTKEPIKRPSHDALGAREGVDGKTYYTHVGVAFEHGDKGGFNIELDAYPVNPRIILRTYKERLRSAKEDQEQQNTKQEMERGD